MNLTSRKVTIRSVGVWRWRALDLAKQEIFQKTKGSSTSTHSSYLYDQGLWAISPLQNGSEHGCTRKARRASWVRLSNIIRHPY